MGLLCVLPASLFFRLKQAAPWCLPAKAADKLYKHLVRSLVLLHTHTHTGTQWLTCDLAGDGQTLHWSSIRRYRYDIIHIWTQVWDGGLSCRCRQSKFFWFFYKNAQSQREAIRKILHYFTSPRVKTGLQKNPIPTVDLRTGRAV